jgi:hypothetical protein
LSLLLILFLASRVFLRVSGFPPSTKINISKFQLDSVEEGPLFGTTVNSYLFYCFILFIVCMNSMHVHVHVYVLIGLWYISWSCKYFISSHFIMNLEMAPEIWIQKNKWCYSGLDYWSS